MKNIDKLNKQKKIITIIEISLIVLFIILFYIACKGPFLPTINGLCAFISLISIGIAIFLNSKRKYITKQIYDISTISKGIEDYNHYDIDEIIKNNKSKQKDIFKEENNTPKYHIKEKTITDSEMFFYNVIKKHFGEKYDIRVQVPLSSVIEKEKDFERQYQNELYRSIDIGIFDLKTTAPLLLIEINDRTHHNKDRKARDSKVKEICNGAGLPLLTFWTKYSNTENYIIKRIRENLER